MKLLIPILLLSSMIITTVAKADQIDDIVNAAMKRRQIPGLALAVLKDGKPIKVKAYGLASVDYDVPVKTDTPFLLASMTKSFTSTAILMLSDDGKLKLDDPISKYLSDTPEAWKDITIRHLLSHTAGLKDRFEEAPFDPTKWKLNYPTEMMYKAARDTPTDSKPGEQFQYSDQGYFLLGMIIEKASGESYGGFLKKHIFEPLDMKNSSTVRIPFIVKGLATGYTIANGTLYHNHRHTDYGMVSHFGMISTVEDLAKWDAALYGDKILKRTTLEAMWKPSKLGNGDEMYISSMGSYGMGWFVDEFNGHRSVGHGGATGTSIVRYPEDKLTIIVLTNLEQMAGGDAGSIGEAIAKTYIPELSWSNFKPKTDPNPVNGENLKKAMDGFGQGTMDEALFEPAFYNLIKPMLPRQKAGLGPLGAVQKVEYLGGKSQGTGKLTYYRISYKAISLYATMKLDAKGKIQFIGVETEEMGPSS